MLVMFLRGKKKVWLWFFFGRRLERVVVVFLGEFCRVIVWM